MRKLLITALSALAISTSAFAADMKVGFVDISYIMAKSPQRVAITEKLKGEFKEQEEELKALLDEYKKLQEKAQKDGATMSEQERIDMSRQAQEMEGKLKLKQNALNEDMKRRGQEEQRMLAGKIMEQINALATEENYDMLVNKEALLFAKPSMNVSDKVLARLGASGN